MLSTVLKWWRGKNWHPNPGVQKEPGVPCETWPRSSSSFDSASLTHMRKQKPWWETQKLSPVSITINRAPCRTACYMEQPMHMRKWILSGETRLGLCTYSSWRMCLRMCTHVCRCKNQREKAGEKVSPLRALLQSGSEHCRCCSTGSSWIPPAAETSPQNCCTNRTAVFCTSLLSDLCGKDDFTTASTSFQRLWSVFSKNQNPNKRWKTLLGSAVNTELE